MEVYRGKVAFCMTEGFVPEGDGPIEGVAHQRGLLPNTSHLQRVLVTAEEGFNSPFFSWGNSSFHPNVHMRRFPQKQKRA